MAFDLPLPELVGQLIGLCLRGWWWVDLAYVGWVLWWCRLEKTEVIRLPLSALPLSNLIINWLRMLWPLKRTLQVLRRVRLTSDCILLLTVVVTLLEQLCMRFTLWLRNILPPLRLHWTVLSCLATLHRAITVWVIVAVPLTLPEVLAAGLRKITLLVVCLFSTHVSRLSTLPCAAEHPLLLGSITAQLSVWL